MGFIGFGERVVDFYEGLAADNSKAYWQDYREVYERDARAPMEALLAELEPEFGPGRVFRPFRDVRFSRDKTPYKTRCAAVVERGRGGGGYYVDVGAEGMRVGGGSFAMASDQLARYREAVDDDRRGSGLARIVDALAEAGWDIRGERLRTRPRGCPAEHPRLELLRHRSLYAIKTWPPDDMLHEQACLARVRAAWQEVRRFNEWVADHVGLSDRW